MNKMTNKISISSLNGICPTGKISLLNQWLSSLNVGFAIAYSLFAYAGGGRQALHASKPVRNLLDAFQGTLFRIAPLDSSLPPSILRGNFWAWR